MFTDFEITVVSMIFRVSFVLFGLFLVVIGIVISRNRKYRDANPKIDMRSNTVNQSTPKEYPINEEHYSSREDNMGPEPREYEPKNWDIEDDTPRRGLLDNFWDDVTRMSFSNKKDDEDD
jgi:hypothetical protein